MTETRTISSARNAVVAMGTQLVTLGLTLITRTVFVTTLGAEILGVNALFLSVAGALTLADLGLNVAVMYALYKPLADGDLGSVRAIVAFCAKLYRRVAISITILGLLLTPVIPRLVSVESEYRHLRLAFCIITASTALTYLMAARSVLLIADQKLYVVKLWTFLFTSVGSIVQVAILVHLGSYLAYLVAGLSFNALGNAYIYLRAGRIFPMLNEPHDSLPPSDQAAIMRAVRDMLIYRVGGVVLNNTDPILISVLVGTVALGYYSNYLLIVSSGLMFLDLFFGSMAASVGQLGASGTAFQKRLVFDELQLLAFWIYGFASIVLLVLLDDVIRLWLGGEFVMSPAVTIGVVLNFYLYGVTAPVMAFRTATSLFRETKYVFLLTASVNLVLSIILGRLFGIPGILFATAIARMATNIWYEPLILFRRYLNGSIRHYLARLLGFTILSGGLVGCLRLVSVQVVGFGSSSSLAAATPLALIVPNVVFYFIFRRSREFVSLVNRIRHVFHESGIS